MDRLKLAMKMVQLYGGKIVYVASLLAFLEVGYLLGMALMDGHIDHDEAIALKAATERVVESLPTPMT